MVFLTNLAFSNKRRGSFSFQPIRSTDGHFKGFSLSSPTTPLLGCSSDYRLSVSFPLATARFLQAANSHRFLQLQSNDLVTVRKHECFAVSNWATVMWWSCIFQCVGSTEVLLSHCFTYSELNFLIFFSFQGVEPSFYATAFNSSSRLLKINLINTKPGSLRTLPNQSWPERQLH